MFYQLLTTLTSQYKRPTRDTAGHQNFLRAIRIIIAIRRAVVG
jgi:hypothetical protein